jgi:ATP-dependent RNA helicase RhlB
MDFSELDLHPDLRRGLDEAGYVTCMPVQEMVFPPAFEGKDIYAQSQTGTGKTAAFLISIFQRIMTVPSERARKVLVLAPTRELAVQIHGEAERLGKHLGLSAGAFYGGVSYGPQVDMLRNNVQIIIGTPGRIIDLVQQGKMLLREVGFLVIDEADRMFDMGFIDDIRKLLRYLPKAGERQTFLFSATLGLRVKDLAWEYMVDPVEIVIEPEHVTVDLVTQELYHVGSHEKLPLLLGIFEREKPESAIIFCNQKFMTEELARRLKINGIDCEYIMGDLPQQKRLEIIERLKEGKLRILVATDVAARGLDIEALDLVVNYDVPEDAESYVHRIGRTARAGKAGKAITLACEKFVYGLPAIEKFIGNKLPVLPVDPAAFGVDRSAGLRFGFGRERGPSRHDGRGGRPAARGYGRPASGPVRGGRGLLHGKPEERRAGAGAHGIAARGGAANGQEQRRRPEPDHAETDRLDQVGNPYKLSQEERMRRYKEKYSGVRQSGAGERRPEGAAGGKGPRPEGQGQGRTRRQGGRGEGPAQTKRGAVEQNVPPKGRGEGPKQRIQGAPGNAGPVGRGPARGQQPAGKTVGKAPQGRAPGARNAPTREPAKKSGILQRIKGLFGGKADK